ncbi:hypothetical protein FGO68_gene1478 [Halteria grandinella]|uniref:Uncharacterized protein n=1 Tax=Halteria grandinella TaxID=5974 RepID=A0A8J8SVS7_HALGN|nr:hypothetical protein FGO68_gene1478 [Halteria grandinella]
MYQKNQSVVPIPQKNDQRNSFKKNEYKPQPQVPTKDYLSNESKKQDYSKTIEVRVDKKHDYLDKKIDSQDKRDQYYDKKPYSSNQKLSQDPDRNSQNLINQLKEEQQQTERLRVELSQAKDKERDYQKRMYKLLEYKIKNRIGFRFKTKR